MNLATLIEIANARYPDDQIVRHWDAATGRSIDRSQGDTLALFIVSELCSSHNPDQSDLKQLEVAMTVLGAAIVDIDRVRQSFLAEILKRRGGAPGSSP